MLVNLKRAHTRTAIVMMAITAAAPFQRFAMFLLGYGIIATIVTTVKTNGASASIIPNACPLLDGQVTSAGGLDYSIMCGYQIDSSSSHFTYEPADQVFWSVNQCLETCDDLIGCLGVNMLPGGACYLSTGQRNGVTAQAGFTAYKVFNGTAGKVKRELKMESLLAKPSGAPA